MRSVTGCNRAQMMLMDRSFNSQHYRNSLDDANFEKVKYIGDNCPNYKIQVGQWGGGIVNEQNNEIWFSDMGITGSEWVPISQTPIFIEGYGDYYVDPTWYTDCGVNDMHCPQDWFTMPLSEIFSGDKAELRDVCMPLIWKCHDMLKNRLKEQEEIWQGELKPYPGESKRDVNGLWKMSETQSVFFQTVSKAR